jgi:hypothetical protein
MSRVAGIVLLILACCAICFHQGHAAAPAGAAPDQAPVAKLLTPAQILSLEKKDAAGIRAHAPASLPAKAPQPLPRVGGINGAFVGGPSARKKNPSVSGHLAGASRNASGINGSDKLQAGNR